MHTHTHIHTHGRFLKLEIRKTIGFNTEIIDVVWFGGSLNGGTVPPNQPSYMPVSVSFGILKHGGELHGA